MIMRRRRAASRRTVVRRRARVSRSSSARAIVRAMPTQDLTPFWAAAAATLMTVGHYMAYGYW